MRKFILISITLMVFAFMARPSFAQEVSLSLSPPLTELTIQPGRSYNQTFTVKNEGATIVIAAKIFPFVPLDATGHAELIENATSVNAFNAWFYFDPTPVSLGTNVSRDFIVKITPPDSAEEKDFYFTFIAEVQNDNNLGVTSSQSQARIGANILINVSKDGSPIKKASIVKFDVAKIIDSFTGLTYSISLGNSGISFYKPIGKIAVEQVMGQTTTLKLAPVNVLVGSTREISCLENEILVPCKLPGKFLIGIYRSNLSFSVDGTGETIEKQTYTFAFPFSILLGLISIFIIYRIMRRITT